MKHLLEQVTDALASRLGTNSDEWTLVAEARKAIDRPVSLDVPDGWKLVPIRATDEMTKAVRYDEDAFGGKSAWPSDIWRDMVRAAPEPPKC